MLCANMLRCNCVPLVLSIFYFPKCFNSLGVQPSFFLTIRAKYLESLKSLSYAAASTERPFEIRPLAFSILKSVINSMGVLI